MMYHTLKNMPQPTFCESICTGDQKTNTRFYAYWTFIQTEFELLIELVSDDPEMEYILNYEVMEGEGKLKNDKGIVLSENNPIDTGNSSWSYLPTKAGNNELTKNISVYVLDKIPFTVTATVYPATVRMSKNSQLIVNVVQETRFSVH